MIQSELQRLAELWKGLRAVRTWKSDGTTNEMDLVNAAFNIAEKGMPKIQPALAAKRLHRGMVLQTRLAEFSII